MGTFTRTLAEFHVMLGAVHLGPEAVPAGSLQSWWCMTTHQTPESGEPPLLSGCDKLLSNYLITLFSSQFHLFCIISFGKQIHRSTVCCMESHLLYFFFLKQGETKRAVADGRSFIAKQSHIDQDPFLGSQVSGVLSRGCLLPPLSHFSKSSPVCAAWSWLHAFP